MTENPLLTSEIEIGRKGNRVGTVNDGSMVFSDRFVPLVRLVDLVNNKLVIIPGTLIEVFVFNRNFWKVDLPFAHIHASDQNKIMVYISQVTSLSPLILENIDVNNTQILEDRIILSSSEKLHCYVNIKKI
jgi:hypothetical protein